MAFCTKCGAQLIEGERFCGGCGAPAHAADTSAAIAVVAAPAAASPAMMQASAVNQDLVLTHLNEAFLTKPEFADGSCKIFEGLYTDVAVSESGYIGFYRPYLPPVGRHGQETSEYFELFHASQIIDIEIDVDEETKTKGGVGGAIVGGLVGGSTGAVIGSAATSGKTKNTVLGIDLIINTKDFRNPRHAIPLYKGNFFFNRPPSYRKADAEAKAAGRKVGLFSADPLMVVYSHGNAPVDRINELSSAIHQLIAAHTDQQAKQAAVPGLSVADELLKFKQLLDAGVLTQEEFDAQKRQLMG